MQAKRDKESILISLVTKMVNKSIRMQSEQEYPDEELLDAELQEYLEVGGKEEDMFNLEVIKEAAEKVSSMVQPSV